jgi:hypothetical protein
MDACCDTKAEELNTCETSTEKFSSRRRVMASVLFTVTGLWEIGGLLSERGTHV